jgi:hypothetical protein
MTIQKQNSNNPAWRVILVCLWIFALLQLSWAKKAETAALDDDINAVKAILDANGIHLDNVSAYISTKDNRVTSLSLTGLGLTTIPPDIGTLTALTSLNLSDNEIGDLPDAITQVPLTQRIQTVEYGCQIYYDGTCISWGNVLVTKDVKISANLGDNKLCECSQAVRNWLDQADANWEATQTCGDAVEYFTMSPGQHLLPGGFNWDRAGKVSIFNIGGKRVKTINNVNMKQECLMIIKSGITSGGSRIPNGFYLLRLDSGKSFHLLKAVIVN